MPRTLTRAVALLATLAVTACGGDDGGDGDASASDGGGASDGALFDGGGALFDGATAPRSLTVTLVPRAGVAGNQRVIFALPLPPGMLTSAANVRVSAATVEIRAARRALATHPDGSLRSVQLQVDVDVDAITALDIVIGELPGSTDLTPVSVESTLPDGDGSAGPLVWALLPAPWLAASFVAGPALPAAEVDGTALDAWDGVCDYATYDTDAFIAEMSARGPWLYDRVTVMYRGYALRGELAPLSSAYREAHIYRDALTGTGAATRIGVPGADGDLKYHYTQGMAIHYLLTGDDRFRESVEDVATRAAALWPDPGYAGGADFWTERHAGFALLAYLWAAMVSDDRAAEFTTSADAAVAAYVDVQDTYPVGYSDPDARCFAHHADAAGEDYGYFGCSPWLSAIVADALDGYARERGGSNAELARTSIVELGRILARDGRDAGGKPLYWMGVGTDQDEADSYDEHWGEPAYVVAMAWHYDGRSDASLRSAAEAMLAGLVANGSAPHIRSFNWQCRSAPLTPWYLH